MADRETELEKLNVLRLSSEESNRISRECLRTALLHLMSEKDFYDISITELVKRAGVSRTTFYRNYESREALLHETIDDLTQHVSALLHSAQRDNGIYDACLELFRELKENASLFHALFSSKLSLDEFFSAPSLMEKIFPSGDDESYYKNAAFEGACLYIIKDWVLSGMPQSPERMADICSRILPFESPADPAGSGNTSV